MRCIGRRGLAFCVFLGACLGAAPGLADEDQTANPLASLEALSNAELENHRAGDAIASNDLSQTVDNTLTGETVSGGDVNFGASTFADQTLNVNVVNTGHNATIQASASIIVNLTP